MDTLLSVNHIGKQYGHNTYALSNISFDLKKGEIFTLLGVNGAGKTTLSSIIATLLKPTSGDIIYQSQSIYKNIPSFRTKISYCAQKPNLNGELTLYDNLYYHGLYFGMTVQAIKERINFLQERLALQDYLTRTSGELSGGYAQRFMIARSLMHSPELLILDEPTVALDPHIRRKLWQLIKDLCRDGITILLTTHYLDEAEYLSDRVCVLSKGVIQLIDTPTQLMERFNMGRLEDVFISLTEQSQNL